MREPRPAIGGQRRLMPRAGGESSGLAAQPTPLVDRERELAEIGALLLRPEVRLVTLTGPGGTGKTRLAIAVAGAVAPAFDHGVHFVDLAPVRELLLVGPSIARALGLRGGPDARLEGLKARVREQQILLVLDNFEQVSAAAADLAELLGACPGLKLLVTSRAALHVRWEHAYPVAPLLVPDLHGSATSQALTSSPAVALFVQRAQAASPHFRLDETNGSAVAEICVRLDGLPLALELAAARVNLLAPPELLTHLAPGLGVLGHAARDEPPRHHTLQAAMDWSYDLLGRREQTVLQRLAIFAGGWTLSAAEAVCADQDGTIRPHEVLDALGELVDQSLVLAEPGAVAWHPYRLLETIRQYAWGRLASASAEGVALLQERHTAFFARLAREAETGLNGPDPEPWLARLQPDYDNLRVALHWAVEHGRIDEAGHLSSVLWELSEHTLAPAKAEREPAAKQEVGPLTPREQEVAILVARGLSNRQIAAALVIADGTVEKHIANILGKLELSSRAQLAVWIAEHGLLAARSA